MGFVNKYFITSADPPVPQPVSLEKWTRGLWKGSVRLTGSREEKGPGEVAPYPVARPVGMPQSEVAELAHVAKATK